MDYINTIKEKIKEPTQVTVLNEDMIWQQHGPLIWQADAFQGEPFFYNVYQY